MKDKTLTEELIEGSFWGAFSNFLNRFGTMIFMIIIARFLFPENFGIYSLTMSLALVYMTFADLGINQMMVRYLSLHIKEKEKAASYFQYIYKIKFLLSFIVAFALVLSSYPISFWIYKKPQLFFPLIMASLFIVTSLFSSFFSSIFYAIKKTKYIGIGELMFQIMRMGVIILIFILLASSYHILGIFSGLILTNLFMILILLLWLNKISSFIFKKSKIKIDRINVLKFLGFITIASISGIFFTYVDTIMLGFFVSFSYVGFYQIAFDLVFGLISLFTYLGVVFLPIFNRLENQKLEKAFNKVLRFILIFSIPTTFGAIIFGKFFINTLYGSGYAGASQPFYILSLLLITYVPTTIISSLFYSKGEPKNIAIAVFITLTINIVLNYILISNLVKISELYATVGAALATIISRYLYFFYLCILTKKKFNIKIKKTNFIKPVFSGLIMFSFLYLLNSQIFKEINIFIATAEIISGVFIYFLVMIITKGVSTEDLKIIRKIPIFKK